MKETRLKQLSDHAGFRFIRLDIADTAAMAELFGKERYENILGAGVLCPSYRLT
ncbi:MAG: hypothetical protein M5R42_12620 [Rhodocyclaceae bacterium]|nr:hypothetical protein [Rhodocyclaceae bacterium]